MRILDSSKIRLSQLLKIIFKKSAINQKAYLKLVTLSDDLFVLFEQPVFAQNLPSQI